MITKTHSTRSSEACTIAAHSMTRLDVMMFIGDLDARVSQNEEFRHCWPPRYDLDDGTVPLMRSTKKLLMWNTLLCR